MPVGGSGRRKQSQSSSGSGAETGEALKGQIPLWPLLVFHLLLAIKLVLVWRQADFAFENGFSALAILGFVVFEDGAVLGALVLLLLGRRWLPRLATGLASGLLVAYGLDLVLLHSLFGRLTLLNVTRYAVDVHLASVFVTPPLLLGSVLVLQAAWWTRKRPAPIPASRWLALGAAVLVVLPSAVSALGWNDPYLDLTLPSVLRLNAQQVLRRGVSDASFERAKALYPRLWARMLAEAGPRTRGAGRARGEPPAGVERLAAAAHPNLIVVLSESLSRVDSERSGGLFDRLPHLDALAADGTTFTNLVADGADTTQAMAALLAGEEPFTTPLLTASMGAYYPTGRPGGLGPLRPSLVTRARELGYDTWFLTNAPLQFQGNGAWLRALGFGQVEGGEDPRYAAVPRYSFDSPADGVLFSRAAERIGQRSARPFLLVLLTVSLHAPYQTPEPSAGDGPLLSALRYVDGSTGAFYQHLRDTGYFDSGYLLIVGDHRRMTPLEPQERHDLGMDSLGRVFGCLVGPGLPPGSVAETPLNQSDLFELAGDLLRGSFSFADGFDRYNKGNRNHLETEVTTHLLSAGRGLVLVRRPERAPYTVQIAASSDPVAAAPSEIDRRIAAYIVLRTRLLQERQEAARP